MNTTINHDSPTATRFDRVRMCALATAAVAPCALAVLWLAAPDCLMNALRSKERDADLRKQTTKKVEIVDDSRLPNDDWRAKLDALYPDENFNDRLNIPAPPAPELDDDYDLAAKMEEFVPSDDFANFDPGDAALPEAPHTDDIALRDEYDDSLYAVSAFDVAAPDSFDDEIARNAPPQNAGPQGEIAPNEAAPDDIAQSEIVPSEVAQSDVLSNETAPNEIVPNEVAPNEIAQSETNATPSLATPSLAESNPLAPVSEEEVFGDFFASTNDAAPLPPAPSPERPLPVDALPEPEPVEAPTYALDAGNDAVLADAAPVAPVSNFDIPLTEESPAPALDASNALPSALPNALPSAPNQVAATGRQTPSPGLEQPISPQQKTYPQDGLVAQESEPSPEVNAIAAQPPLPSVGESTSAYLETPSAPAAPAEPIAPDAQAFASNDAQAAPSSEIADNSESLTDAEREAARRIAAYDLVAATEPSYFSRAFDLYGGSNAFSMLNFARAAKIIDESAAFNPRAISSAFDAPPKFLANASANETTNEPANDDSYPPELAFNPNPIEHEESTAPASPAPAPETSPELAPAPESAPTSNAPAEPNVAPPAMPNAAPEVGAQAANSNKVALVGYEEKPKAPQGANVGYIAKSSTQRGSNPVASLESELGALGLIGARVERWDAARWRASGARSLGENGGLEFRQGFGASPREAVDSLKQDLNASNVR